MLPLELLRYVPTISQMKTLRKRRGSLMFVSAVLIAALYMEISWLDQPERLHGYTEAEALGQHIGFIVAPGHETKLHESQERAFHEPVEIETQARRKDGELWNASVTLAP